MRNGAHKGRRGSADGDVEGHQNSTTGRSPATHSALTEPIEIAKFWRNRRGESVVVTLKDFKGKAIVDFRVHFQDRAGITQPSTKGLALMVRRLPDLLKAVQKANDKAAELGLLGGDE